MGNETSSKSSTSKTSTSKTTTNKTSTSKTSNNNTSTSKTTTNKTSTSNTPANKNTSTPKASVEAKVVEDAEGEAMSLWLDQTVAYEDVEIRWVDIKDSRCPINANCIWAGEAVIRLQISDPNKESVEIELLVGGRNESSPAKEVFGHQFKLLNVNPYPIEGVDTKRDGYQAEMIVVPRP